VAGISHCSLERLHITTGEKREGVRVQEIFAPTLKFTGIVAFTWPLSIFTRSFALKLLGSGLHTSTLSVTILIKHR
jgi:hypothetical protein